ncbi:peptidase inhibitor family I36 protein [Actinoplanes sp. NPDC049548]|uniref:peptidase inhibitor family I36 protein n=1 Tax=Actinoplanes sp. NPDC049548 TaxID=3155152 RepID=UPI003430392C
MHRWGRSAVSASMAVAVGGLMVVCTSSAAEAAIACPSGYVCIYPDINYGGQPYVRRASDGSVSDLPDSIDDRGSSVINNSTRTARIYVSNGYSGRHVCVRSAIADLRSYDMNDRTRSLKINNDACG